MLAFLAAVFFLIITPGPGVLSTAGVGSAFGAQAGYRYVTGLFIGTNLVALAVVTGVARIAFAGSRLAFISSDSAPGVLNGIALQIINPKAYVVNTTLFTGFAFSGADLLQETLWKFLMINAIWIPIHLLWLAVGIGLKQLALPAHWQRTINVLMAVSLLIVVALATLLHPARTTN